jgi:hypothetical protein
MPGKYVASSCLMARSRIRRVKHLPRVPGSSSGSVLTLQTVTIRNSLIVRHQKQPGEPASVLPSMPESDTITLDSSLQMRLQPMFGASIPARAAEILRFLQLTVSRFLTDLSTPGYRKKHSQTPPATGITRATRSLVNIRAQLPAEHWMTDPSFRWGSLSGSSACLRAAIWPLAGLRTELRYNFSRTA